MKNSFRKDGKLYGYVNGRLCRFNDYAIEVTDSYGGEANYSWVRRYSITLQEGASDLAVIRAAKRAAGYNGHRCSVDRYGDSWTLHPSGQCVLIFVNFVEGEGA